MNYRKEKEIQRDERRQNKTKVTFITTSATRNNWRFCDWFDEKLEITNKLKKKTKKKLNKKIRILTQKKEGKKKGIFQRSPEKKKLTY